MSPFQTEPYTLPQLKQGIAMLVGRHESPKGGILTLMVNELGEDPAVVTSSAAHTTIEMSPLRQVAFYRVEGSRPNGRGAWLFVGPISFSSHELDLRGPPRGGSTPQDDVQLMVREAIRRKIAWPYHQSSVNVTHVELGERRGASLLVEVRILLDD